MSNTQKLTGVQFDAKTNETVVYELSSEELEQRTLDEIEHKAFFDLIANTTAARASALTKLVELGLTDDEISALVG
jgi:uroporphyrinogen-III synthase